MHNNFSIERVELVNELMGAYCKYASHKTNQNITPSSLKLLMDSEEYIDFTSAIKQSIEKINSCGKK